MGRRYLRHYKVSFLSTSTTFLSTCIVSVFHGNGRYSTDPFAFSNLGWRARRLIYNATALRVAECRPGIQRLSSATHSIASNRLFHLQSAWDSLLFQLFIVCSLLHTCYSFIIGRLFARLFCVCICVYGGSSVSFNRPLKF